ncbi:hypothetical protein [Anaeromyxobacter paludicola]|uniref:DZANK-type domain-containing protein n=1 Tax=Anaeromyxobacter paludicola TaxID=2918171 RepID=A0ABM7X744_9BACT|nr:hypothetical protein [Anaeromyxobacter paludicola]BDG07671.1 hypothetical protein AMPC_07840 [Anaeromyxobacter paludicola]
MIVCPVCEHAQVSPDECEVCGKRFRPGPAGGEVTAPPEAWLEPTALDEARSGAVAPIAELEPTRFEASAAAPAPIPDLEPTAAAAVEVPAERLADFEPTLADVIPGDRPTAVPAVLVCRYCRTPASPGELLCGRCGMRLPVLHPVAPVAPRAAPVPCPSCGTPGEGERCIACGARRSRSG